MQKIVLALVLMLPAFAISQPTAKFTPLWRGNVELRLNEALGVPTSPPPVIQFCKNGGADCQVHVQVDGACALKVVPDILVVQKKNVDIEWIMDTADTAAITLSFDATNAISYVAGTPPDITKKPSVAKKEVHTNKNNSAGSFQYNVLIHRKNVATGALEDCTTDPIIINTG